MIFGHGDDAFRFQQVRANFSSNIFPHPDLRGLKQFLARHLDAIDHYPEPECTALERLIAEKVGVLPENIVVTAGAVEAIYLIAQAFGGRPTHILQRPTFSEYADAAALFGSDETDAASAELIWLCNPNNPTGEALSGDQLAALMDAHPQAKWVVDQSYEDYTLVPPVAPCQAVETRFLQIHSMTKRCAVPGLRLGWVAAHAEDARKIRQCLRPWSVNALAAAAGEFLWQTDFCALRDAHSYLAEAQRLNEMLRQVDGVDVMPTQTNFMLARLQRGTAAQLKEFLMENHQFLIRDASNFRSLTPQHFRVAAQLPSENDELVAAIKTFVSHA